MMNVGMDIPKLRFRNVVEEAPAINAAAVRLLGSAFKEPTLFFGDSFQSWISTCCRYYPARGRGGSVEQIEQLCQVSEVPKDIARFEGSFGTITFYEVLE